MKKNEFFKDKNRKIRDVVYELMTSLLDHDERRYTDKELGELRNFANELQKQVHELNAGRNIFLDNDKDQ